MRRLAAWHTTGSHTTIGVYTQACTVLQGFIADVSEQVSHPSMYEHTPEGGHQTNLTPKHNCGNVLQLQAATGLLYYVRLDLAAANKHNPCARPPHPLVFVHTTPGCHTTQWALKKTAIHRYTISHTECKRLAIAVHDSTTSALIEKLKKPKLGCRRGPKPAPYCVVLALPSTSITPSTIAV